MNNANEPSMNLVRRLAQTAPDKLVEEVAKLRADRDNLREALSLKLVDYIRSINITDQDLLIVRRPERMTPELILEVVEKVAFVLQTRYNWNGVVIVGSETEGLDRLTDDEKMNLYYLLKAMVEKSEGTGEKQSGETDAKP